VSSIAPGWYKDPADPSTQRYWDGEGWLGAPLPVDATPPPGPPPTTPGKAEHVAMPRFRTAPAFPAASASAEPEPAGTGSVAAPEAAVPPGATPASPPGAATASPPGAASASPPGAGAASPPATGPVRLGPRGAPPPPLRNAPPGWPHPAYAYAPATPIPRPHGFALASLGARFVARLIDIGAVLALNAVVNGWFIWQYVIEVAPYFRELGRRLGSPNPNFDDMQQSSPRAGYLLMVIILLAAALWFAYEVPAVANTGQTLGKRVCGVKVVRLESPDQLGFGRSMRRWNTLGLPTLLWTCFGIGFALQFVDCFYATVDRPMRQALHDKSARTVVVQVRSIDAVTASPDTSAKTDTPAAERPTPDGTDQSGGTS
jgi:uncharacterized RDD family membrane protein YckC